MRGSVITGMVPGPLPGRARSRPQAPVQYCEQRFRITHTLGRSGLAVNALFSRMNRNSPFRPGVRGFGRGKRSRAPHQGQRRQSLHRSGARPGHPGGHRPALAA